MKHLFYATEWAPNGTNTLLILDENHQLVDAIDEALFGVRVSYESRMESQTLLFDDFVGIGTRDDVETGLGVLVQELSKGQVLKHIACSPLDPNGRSVMNALEKYFVKGGK